MSVCISMQVCIILPKESECNVLLEVNATSAAFYNHSAAVLFVWNKRLQLHQL